MAPRVTVKDLRAEARRRLLHCGNGKTISRMNKGELLSFMSCICHPDSDRYEAVAATQSQPSLAGMYKEPKGPRTKKRKGKSMPSNYMPVREEPEDLSGFSFSTSGPKGPKKRKGKRKPVPIDSDEEEDLGGAGLPTNYRDFVRAMLPHVRAKGLAPQAAMKTVAMMWRKHKAQHGSGLVLSGNGLNLTGAQSGMGAASTISSTAKGAAATLGLAGLAQPELAPILEPAAAASAGVGYIADLFK